jgi:hypothetical protein
MLLPRRSVSAWARGVSWRRRGRTVCLLLLLLTLLLMAVTLKRMLMR